MNNKQPTRLTIDELLELIDEPNRIGCKMLLHNNRKLFTEAYGSVHNHQAWPGGYLDHLVEIMNYAVIFYATLLSTGRPVNFSLSDVLLILFIHDIEKPWKYRRNKKGDLEVIPSLRSKVAQHKFRLAKIREYFISLTKQLLNAFKYVEGEFDKYNERGRVMNELAGFCHMMDVCSARVVPEYPLAENDPWAGAIRSKAN